MPSGKGGIQCLKLGENSTIVKFSELLQGAV